MPKDPRKIVTARREIARKIADVFLPLEVSAQETATQAARCVATMLEAHGDASLPPTAGHDVIELLSDAARLAAQSRGKVMQAHGLLRRAADDLNIAYSDPDCPPNSGVESKPLRIVA